MIPPITLEEETAQGSACIECARQIRDRYHQSGLYELEGGGKCVWHTQFYSSEPGFISRDGKYVLFPGPFSANARPAVTDIVFHCIEDGTPLSSPVYSHASPRWQLKKIILLGKGVYCVDYGCDADKGIFWIETSLWERITFDAATGRVISFIDPIGQLVAVTAVAMLIAIAFVSRILVRRIGRRDLGMQPLNREQGRKLES
jgi:hypothetical protein